MEIVALAAVFALAVVPLFLTPILPTIDFYDHLTRYWVLAKLPDNPFLQANYRSEWGLLPNIGLDVLASPLMRVLPPLVVGKIVALLIFATQYTGVLVFNRALTGRTSWVTGLICVPFLYSFIFTWGFANFLFGLGLVFWGAAIWLKLRGRLALAIPIGCVVAVLIYLVHGVAFGLYGLLLGALELGLLLERRQGLAGLAARLAGLALQAVGPALLFADNAKRKVSGGVTNVDETVGALTRDKQQLVDRIVELVLYRAETILRVAESPSRLLDFASFAVLLAVLTALMWRGAARIPKAAWPALGIGAVLVALMPPALFQVGFVADRMPLFLAFLVVGVLAWGPALGREGKALVGVLCVLVAGRLAVIGLDWSRYGRDAADFARATAPLPPGQTVAYVHVRLNGRLTAGRRCEMYGPLLTSLRGGASTLWALPGAMPLRVQGELLEALPRLVSPGRLTGEAARAFYSQQFVLLTRQPTFDYAVACDLDRLGQPLPVGVTPVATSGRFTLLKLPAAPP